MDRGLTEIHMHVIPNVDDGAESFEESLQMLRLAETQGIRNIVATPHSFAFEDWSDDVYSGYDKLRSLIVENGIGINLMLGTEIYADRYEIKDIIKRLRKGIYPTLNGSRYVLTEYSRDEDYAEVLHCVDQICNAGYIPVIAHAEKTGLDMTEILSLKEMGCLIQANYADIIPREGYVVTTRAAQMLKEHLIDLISTDAHNMTYRKPMIQDALEYIKKTCTEDYVEDLLFKNPAKIFAKM